MNPSFSENFKGVTKTVISDSPKIHIEYGEKTWSTRQTVVDIFQNHLDAGTDISMDRINSEIFKANGHEVFNETKKIFLEKLYYLLKNNKYMSRSAFDNSLLFLDKEFSDIKNQVHEKYLLNDKKFNIDEIMASCKIEEFPTVKVIYKNKTDSMRLCFSACDEIPTNIQRDYQLDEIQIMDKGLGYDHKLSSLFMSNKRDESLLRGKFGEGSKMSYLHLLRNGAKLKFRSTFKVGDQSKVISWQKRSGVENEMLKNEGVMIEKMVENQAELDAANSGSLTSIKLKGCNRSFINELSSLFLNSDKKRISLSHVISDFNPETFLYPLGLSEDVQVGVGLKREYRGGNLYIQGLLVEEHNTKLAYSYNIADKNLINGRDRNTSKNIDRYVKKALLNIDDIDILNNIIDETFMGSIFDKRNETVESDVLTVLFTVNTNYIDDEVEKKSTARLQKIMYEKVSDFINERNEDQRLLLTTSSTEEEYDNDKEYWKNYEDDFDGPESGYGDYEDYSSGLSNRNSLDRYKDFPRGNNHEYIYAKNREDITSDEIVRYANLNDFTIQGFGEWSSNMLEVIKMNYKGSNTILNYKDIEELIMDESKIVNMSPERNEEFEKSCEKINELVRVTMDSLLERNLLSRLDLHKLSGVHFLKPNQSRVNEESKLDLKRTYRSSSEWLHKTSLVPIGIAYDSEKESDILIIDPLLLEHHFRHMPNYGDKGKVLIMENYLLDILKNPAYRERSNYFEVMQGAQFAVDRILEKKSSVIKCDNHKTTELHNYEKNDGMLHRLIEGLLNQGEDSFSVYDKMHEFEEVINSTKYNNSDIYDMIEVLKSIPDTSFKYYRSRDIKEFIKKLQSLVLLEGETMTYVNREGETTNRSYQDSLNITSKNNLHTMYMLETDLAFIPWLHKEDCNYVKYKNENENIEIFKFNEKWYLRNENSSRRKFFQLTHSNCVQFYSTKDGLILRQNDVKNNISLNDLSFEYESRKNNVIMPPEIIEGIRETSISIEYGIDEWDNPVRIFQDILQNHLDASKDKPPELTFKIRNSKNEFAWVSKSKLKDDDNIIGLKITDNGNGYDNTNIDTMGFTTKHNPLNRGKYGEGLKMVTASAIRNGISITYESCQEYNGEYSSWIAKGVGVAKEIFKKGTLENREIIGFDVTGSQREMPGSATIIEMPDDSNEQQLFLWDSWVNIIDPRLTNVQGHGGLERYCLQIRHSNANQVQVGPVIILLDEPNVVYENGLLISTEANKSSYQKNYNFGFSVPSLVNTRERNNYKPELLNDYVMYAIMNADDSRIRDRLIQGILEKNMGIREQKINYDFNKTESAPLREYARSKLGNRIIFSREQIENRLREIEKQFKKGDTSLSEEYYIQKMKLANMVYLEKEQLVEPNDGVSQFLDTIFIEGDEFCQNKKLNTLDLDEDITLEIFNVYKSLYVEVEKCISSGLIDNSNKELDTLLNITSLIFTKFDIQNMGHYSQNSKTIGLNESIISGFKKDKGIMIATILHELSHAVTDGANDFTDEFLNTLKAMVALSVRLGKTGLQSVE